MIKEMCIISRMYNSECSATYLPRLICGAVLRRIPSWRNPQTLWFSLLCIQQLPSQLRHGLASAKQPYLYILHVILSKRSQYEHANALITFSGLVDDFLGFGFSLQQLFDSKLRWCSHWLCETNKRKRYSLASVAAGCVRWREERSLAVSFSRGEFQQGEPGVP